MEYAQPNYPKWNNWIAARQIHATSPSVTARFLTDFPTPAEFAARYRSGESVNAAAQEILDC